MNLLRLISNLIDRINASEGPVLEASVRKMLILYHMRASNQAALETTTKLNISTPVQFHGKGKIRVAPGVVFGVVGSPGNLSHSYIDARTENSLIAFGENTSINNRASIISVGASITIGRNCLIGQELIINDSNGHELAVARRLEPDANPRPVTIGNNVFIGARVTILKGVTIGDGCVIAAGSVLTPGFTAENNKTIGGNPARVIGDVPQ
jgi:acetyltransferase-like isoleucine patch superfamily enzyme